MTLHNPAKYIDFIAYCNKRKSFSKAYADAKRRLYEGELLVEDYFSQLRKIQQDAIELELQYFDILHMRH